MTDRPPRPEVVAISTYEEGAWEVLIETHTGLQASLKVGVDEHGDGEPMVGLDVEGDETISEIEEIAAGFDYAFFRGIPEEDPR